MLSQIIKNLDGANIAQYLVARNHSLKEKQLNALIAARGYIDHLDNYVVPKAVNFSVTSPVKLTGEINILQGKNTQIGKMGLERIEKYQNEAEESLFVLFAKSMTKEY